MVNSLWLFLIIMGIIVAVFTGRLQEVTDSAISSAKSAVELALGLIGIYALWLGLMNIARKAGLIARISRLIKPITRVLFKDVPPDHGALGSITMNIIANMLGMGNAATPFGLRAMKELQQLNKDKKTATNAMCTFLVINTSSVQLIPTTIIAIRSAAGSGNPTEIIGTALIATMCSTMVGIMAVKSLEKIF